MWLGALLLMCLTHTHAEYSALQTVVSQKGLQKVTHWLTDWLQNELNSIVLPEVSGRVRVMFANVEYVLYNMSVQRCDLPEPSVAFSEGTGISLQVNGLSVAIRGNWRTQYGIIYNRGWFDLVMYTINFNTVLQLSSAKNHLSISTILCSADVESVEGNFYGGRFIFKSFLKFLSNRIKNDIPGKICPAFKKGIEDLEIHLAAMPGISTPRNITAWVSNLGCVAVKLDPYVYMNISLTDSPVMKDSGLGLNIKGEFYRIFFPSEPPFSPNQFQLPWREDYMVSLGASEFCVNSAAYAYHSAGVLQMHITEDMIPKESPFHLNTSQFGVLIPQLPKKYPDMQMDLLLYSSETPLFAFKKTVMNAHLFASVKAFVMKLDTVAIPLFRLDVKSSFSVKAYTDRQLLKGVLKMQNLTVTLGSSEIGDFSIAPIEQAVKSAINNFVLPKVNAQLKDGIQLPFVKGFRPRNSLMTIENGFLAVAMDISGPYNIWQ